MSDIWEIIMQNEGIDAAFALVHGEEDEEDEYEPDVHEIIQEAIDLDEYGWDDLDFWDEYYEP